MKMSTIYESPDKQGQSIEEDYQLVRLQVRQKLLGTTDRVIKFLVMMYNF